MMLWLLLLPSVVPAAAAAASSSFSAHPPVLGRSLLVQTCKAGEEAQRWRIHSSSSGSSSSSAAVVIIESLAHPGSCVNCPGAAKCHSWTCAEGDPNGSFDISYVDGSSEGPFTIRGAPPFGGSCVSSVGLGGLLSRASPCTGSSNSSTSWRQEAETLASTSHPALCLTFGLAPPPAVGVCPDGTDCRPAGGTCCKLKEPFGFGCALGGGSVCCEDKVHYCPAGHTCNASKAAPPAGHTGAWGDIGAWGCDPKPGAEGAEERARAMRLQELPPPPPPVSTQGIDCFVQAGGRPRPWKTWPSTQPAAHCAAGSAGDQNCVPYERSTDLQVRCATVDQTDTVPKHC